MSKISKEKDVLYMAAGERVVGDIPPLTFDNMDTPIQRAHTWYVRMGRPNRGTMKKKVQDMIDVNHPHINITAREVDVLPWNEAGVVKLSWEQEDAARKAREREEAALKRQKELEEQLQRQKERAEEERFKKKAMEERLRKMKEAKDKKAAEERKALEAEDARTRLENYCQKLKQRIWLERAGRRITLEDKDSLEAAIDDVLNWMEAHPEAKLEEIEQKHEELAGMAKSIFAKISNAKQEESRLEAEKAKKRLEEYCKNIETYKNLIDGEDKETLGKAIDKTKKWLNENSKGKKEEYVSTHKELEAIADPILDKLRKRNAAAAKQREGAEAARKSFEDFLNSSQYSIDWDSIPQEDMKTLSDAIDDAWKWLRDNPKATKEQYETKLKEKEKELGALVNAIQEKEEERRREKEAAAEAKQRLADFLDSYPLSINAWEHLTDNDKKTILEAIDEGRKWMDSNPNGTNEQYEAKLKEKQQELDALTKSILERLKNEEAAKARKRLEDFLDNYPSSIIEWKRFTDGDKKTIVGAINIGRKWIDLNPNATKEQYETKLKEKQEELNAISKSILERLRREEAAKAKKRLEDFLDNYPSSIIEWQFFKSDDKKIIMDAINGGRKWMDSNPNATKEQYETKLKEKKEELDALSKPILERLRKEEIRRKSIQMEHESAGARKGLKDFLDNYPSSIIEWGRFTDDDEKIIMDAIDEGRKWMNSNCNATKEQYGTKLKEKQEELGALIKPILEQLKHQEVAKAKKRLQDFLDNYPSSIIEWERFTDDDKKTIVDAIDEAKQWMDSNPNTTKEQYETKLKEKEHELDSLTKPILERLKEEELKRQSLQEEQEAKEKIEREVKARAAEAKRKRDEQKRAEQEKRLKELEDRRKLIEQLEADALERELTADEKRLTKEFYETRMLIAYHWWGRLNRPFQKKMIKMIETLDSMRYANVKPKDVNLLPWLGDGFVVDVPKMSGLMANLDTSVVEQVDRWM